MKKGTKKYSHCLFVCMHHPLAQWHGFDFSCTRVDFFIFFLGSVLTIACYASFKTPERNYCAFVFDGKVTAWAYSHLREAFFISEASAAPKLYCRMQSLRSLVPSCNTHSRHLPVRGSLGPEGCDDVSNAAHVSINDRILSSRVQPSHLDRTTSP